MTSDLTLHASCNTYSHLLMQRKPSGQDAARVQEFIRAAEALQQYKAVRFCKQRNTHDAVEQTSALCNMHGLELALRELHTWRRSRARCTPFPPGTSRASCTRMSWGCRGGRDDGEEEDDEVQK